MKVILRDPPLVLLLMAIALDFPVNRSAPRDPQKKRGWLWRHVGRFAEWRNSVANRALRVRK